MTERPPVVRRQEAPAAEGSLVRGTGGRARHESDFGALKLAPLLERLFRTSRNVMLVADDSRRYTHANPAASALLETPHDQLLEMSVDDFTPAEFRGQIDQIWAAFIEAGWQSGSYTLELPSGRRREVEYSATANISPGHHLSVFLRPMPGIEHASTHPDGSAARLTPREREILGLVALGATTQGVAEQLVISPETVTTHVKSAIEKLNARNRAHAVLLGIRSGQVDLFDD